MPIQLKKIKMAGFKSFVDPTTLDIQSPRVGVVGPNGCGKSNVIDAVRWVMGESSAKNLRGESMSDVIFNGSTARKPVGQASVELIFDNSDGSLGGEYAQYAEISIKRLGTRDNQSVYFLNGTRCRRRDITDIFLGTGLGPRSYAIIEQGMISRVIEAKPEELRSFFEEAAGISLYRKRRHETELRIRHTRENLERLEDIRQELDKQLERLRRQSEAAHSYREYKETHDKLELELYTLKWRALDLHLQEQTSLIRNQTNRLEEKLAHRANIDLNLEKKREVHTEKQTECNEVQSRYYDIAAQIARIEQNLQHHQERFLQCQQDLESTQSESKRIESQIEQDQTRYDTLTSEFTQLEPCFIEAKIEAEKAAKVLSESEEALRHWTQGFEQFQREAEVPTRVAEVEKARILQFDRNAKESQLQLEKLRREQGNINLSHIEQLLADLEHQVIDLEIEGEEYTQKLNEIVQTLSDKRKVSEEKSASLAETRKSHQTLTAREISLKALQQVALGKETENVKQWLQKTGLEKTPRLGESLEVEKGYERALETVLGRSVEALCVSEFGSILDSIQHLEEVSLTFLENANFENRENSSKNKLINKIKTRDSNFAINSFIENIYIVDSLEEALSQRNTLLSHESIVTKDGLWFGRNWLKINRGKESQSGIFEREAELKEISEKRTAVEQRLASLEAELEENRTVILTLEKERETIYGQAQAHGKAIKELSTKASSERTRLDHERHHLVRTEEELAGLTQRLQQLEEDTGAARLSLQKALDDMAIFNEKRTLLLNERDKLKELLSISAKCAREAKDKAHEYALKHQALITQQNAMKEGMSRLTSQQGSIQNRVNHLEKQLQSFAEPEAQMKQELEKGLNQRLLVEEELKNAREVLEGIENELKLLEKERLSLEESLEKNRNELEQLKMDWQGLTVRLQTVQEKLQEHNIEELLKVLPEDAEEQLWTARLEEISKKIQRLGAINMAAIEEYQSESERKSYLDSQNKDLTEALETLENAIRKIDKETRQKFKETFDKVNGDFQALYPRLFGGGQAYLELIGEDLLEAGITVMARPPGKRNSSIHLLSGGEKALTAVSLVFAIFQLNPAPFCMLDEVDAPLDDVNVGRFCELVKHMSNTVQFIYITHNKITMEMAHHLIGVTMKEPGVSRLVSVDVAEAFALAES